MELGELQQKIMNHGNRFRKKSNDMKQVLPNEVSFPIFKAIEELGEVSDLLVRRYGLQRKGKEISADVFREKLGEELVDVITTLIHLANFSDIDLENSFRKKLNEMDERWNNQEY